MFSKSAACRRLWGVSAITTLGAMTVVTPMRGQTPIANLEHKYGYIVIGPTLRQKFSVAGPDTVPEVRLADTPRAIRDSAGASAHRAKYEPACNRYFHSSSTWVVLASVRCGAKVEIDDGERILVLDSRSGRIVGVVPSPTPGYYVAVYPDHRSRQ